MQAEGLGGGLIDLRDRPPLVLVIGAGFIGSHICHRLLLDGHAVRMFTRSLPEPAHLQLVSGAELVIGQATDPVAVERAMDGVDWVVFGAGGLVPAASQTDPMFDVVLSLEPLLTVLRAIERRPGTAFTYLSSGGTVYGQSLTLSIREDHPTNPITTYGILKLTGEKFTAAYAERNGFPCRILRIANVYGEGQRTNRGQGAVGAFIKAIANGEPVTLFGDGGIVRDFVHVSDVAAAVVRLRPLSPTRAVGDPQDLIFNVGSGTGTTLVDLLRTVEELFGKPAVLNRQPARPFDVQRNVLDIGKLTQTCRLSPRLLSDGLQLAATELVA